MNPVRPQNMMSNNSRIIIGDLFPNPPMPDGGVYLNCSGSIQHALAVIIKSDQGNVVYEAAHNLPNSGGTIFMDLSALLPGEYEVMIVCGYYKERRKLYIWETAKKSIWKKWFN
ncbi:MAG: hypothetical protein IPM47_21180 [Sphingobacteriales bacterium]|nr:MAG: hypothetical protein IPM47_21180 [Sphingobacteriales bacterium]